MKKQPTRRKRSPRIFISYSWEDQHHTRWVERLATDLATIGAAVTLDRWHLAPGDQIARFMTQAIAKNDFVLLICTEGYKQKADRGLGNVAFESDLMSAELAQRGNHRKFIPILARGTWKKSGPRWVTGKLYLDMRESVEYRASLAKLRDTIIPATDINKPRRRKVEHSVDLSESLKPPFGGRYVLPEVNTRELLEATKRGFKSGMHTVIYFDVDGLLGINAKHGAQVGDAVMERISNMVSDLFRDHFAYRLINRSLARGGDQFVCLVGADNPVALAKKCITNIRAYDWAQIKAGLHVTVTACVYTEPDRRRAGAAFIFREIVQHLAAAKQMDLGSLIRLDAHMLELKAKREDRDDEDYYPEFYAGTSL